MFALFACAKLLQVRLTLDRHGGVMQGTLSYRGTEIFVLPRPCPEHMLKPIIDKSVSYGMIRDV
jgi:hypothetical protein